MSETVAGPSTRPAVLQVVSTGARAGVSGVVSLLVRGLQRQGFAPTVLCLDAGPLVEEVRGYGIPAEVLAVERALDPAAVLRARAILTRGRYHVVHTHGARAMFVGNLAARLAGGSKVVTSFHEISTVKSATSNLYRLYYQVEGGLARWCTDRCVATSQAVLDDAVTMRRIPAERLTLIRNGVDLEKFHRVGDAAELKRFRARIGIRPGDVMIGTLGSMVTYKGHVHLIEALARIRVVVPAARVVIAGVGTLRPDLERRAREFGLADHVLLPGDVSEANLLHNCLDVFVLPSLSESTPLVVLEAVACGVPVVASAVGGVPDLLAGGAAGLLVPPGDSAAIASAVLRLLGDRELRERNVAAARAHVAKEYAGEVFTVRHVELYRTLLAGRA